MKTRGQEDAISDINGPVGEGRNEELIPAWGPEGTKGQQPHPGRAREPAGLPELQENPTVAAEGQEAKEGSKVKRSETRPLTCPQQYDLVVQR